MKELRKLYEYIKKSDTKCVFRPVINVERDYLFLIDDKGTKIFYNDFGQEFIIKCRVKCIKDDNFITYLNDPIIMDLKSKSMRDVLSIINSKI